MDSGPPSASRRGVLASCLGGALAGLAGCVAQGEQSDLDGEILMDGSNTVFPHGAAVAEEFLWRNADVQIPASGSGTGAGFQRFCAGETEFQNASRQILPDEVERCSTEGVEYLELEALLDGIAIMKHPDNDWCDELTVEELNRIWRSDSDVETWRDVRPEADPPWPDEEIELYGRDSASGTYDYFTNAINDDYGDIRTDYSGTPDTNVIVRGVRGNKYALGWGGAGFYQENSDDLDLVAVDNGDGPVRPTRENIESREYQPLSRAMYVYIRKDALSREEVAAFARFYFEQVDDEGIELGREVGAVAENETEITWTQWAARRVGFFAVDDETVAESRAKLEDAIAEVAE